MTAALLVGLGVAGGVLLVVMARFVVGEVLSQPEDPRLVDDPDIEAPGAGHGAGTDA